MSLPILALVILIGAVAAVAFRRAQVGAWLSILTITAVIGLGYGVIASKSHDAKLQRKQDLQKAAAQKHLDDCNRYLRSLGNRAQWIDTTSYLALNGLSDAATYLNTKLDLNLPPIPDPGGCA